MMRGGTSFGGWGMAKAQQRAAHLLQEFDARGMLSKTLEALESEKGHKAVAAERRESIDPLAAERQREHARRKSFVKLVVRSKYFTNFILFVILCNCVTIAADVSLPADQIAGVTAPLDALFLAIYLCEFFMKIFADPRAYWRSGYNRFDLVVLIASVIQFILTIAGTSSSSLTVLRVFRSLRALRSFRSIGAVRQLQVIVNALLQSLRRNVLDIVACLFTFMFLFAVMGFYLYSNNDPGDFGSLPQTLLSLMYYVTSSGWAGVQDNLTRSGAAGSQVYSVLFMLLGNFIFTNMFIGVICENIEEAQHADEESQRRIRTIAQQEKKNAFLVKQRSDMETLLSRQDFTSNQSMQKVLQGLAGTLRHDEIVPMTHLACNLTWLEAFMVTQYHLENSMYRCQQTHFRIANTLTELLDRRLKVRYAKAT